MAAAMRITSSPGDQAGFSLLEVILALAVLAVSLAIIGEANSSADRNARRSAAESDATLIAESVLAELAAGTRELVAVEAEPWNDGQQTPTWVISVAPQPTTFDNLLAAQVTVKTIQPLGNTPVSVRLIRWFADPIALPTTLLPDTSTVEDSQ